MTEPEPADRPIAPDNNSQAGSLPQSPGSETVSLGDAASLEPLRRISSAELLQGAREVLIQHDEKTYRLRVTRNGKLILVK